MLTMKKLILYTGLWIFLVGNAVGEGKKTVYGYVEKVTLLENHLQLPAKLDSGAKTASLSAINIKQHEENGKTFLSFIIPTKSGNVPCKAEYAGRVLIKSRAGEAKSSNTPLKRPMVQLKIRLGSQEHLVLFNLTNRKRFNYPVLLGRDALITFDALVDPASAFQAKKDIQFEVSDPNEKI